jgi:hypothetical protein
MFYYIYFDPHVISVAKENGELGMQALIGILRGFLQNCFLADFPTWRVHDAIKEEVENLDSDHNRKKLTTLLKTLQKRNLFIFCLEDDYSGRGDLELIRECCAQTKLDLLLLSEKVEGISGAEVATIFDYQHTQFEEHRSRTAAHGIALSEGELDERQLLDHCLRKALQYAEKIAIYDKLFGEKYKGNYQFTATVLFKWLEEILPSPKDVRIEIHCGLPDPEGEARKVEDMLAELAGLKKGRLSEIRFSLHFYQNDSGHDNLTHDRFIITNQIAIGIPRGMDFIDNKTRRNRDLTMDCKSGREIEKLINSYSSFRQTPVEL